MKEKEEEIGAVEGCCVFSAWNASHTHAHRHTEKHAHVYGRMGGMMPAM